MGGWMSYQRMRNRNHLMVRNVPALYPSPDLNELHRPSWNLIVGDLNRMEQDYLNPNRDGGPGPIPHKQCGDTPAERVAEATGIDVATVVRVLAYVFMEQP